MNGKLIADTELSVSKGTTTITLPEMANGMYTISIKNNERNIAGKVMLIR
jgi:hypothetical protein